MSRAPLSTAPIRTPDDVPALVSAVTAAARQLTEGRWLARTPPFGHARESR
jgi:hypothetical protein